MPAEETIGTLTIIAERAGTVAEISQFLGDLEAAYLQTYRFQYLWASSWSRKRIHRMSDLFLDFGFVYPLMGLPSTEALAPDTVLPEHRLVVKRIRIESPGLWEFAASLNPLQQIREYLNDRHKRRQDKEFREAAERDKLVLENELIQRQVWEKDNAVFRERVLMMRELGFSDAEIRQFVWAAIGRSMAQLGRHQDTGLIERAE